MYNVILRKVQNSNLAYSFMGYLVFMTFYFAAIIMQRNSDPSQSVQAGIQAYMEAFYRDPDTLEMKGLTDIKSIPDFWNWLIIDFLANIIVKFQTNGDPMPKPNILLLHNRLTSGFEILQRRSVKRPCNFADPKFNAFSKYCYGVTLLEGQFGDVDKSDFIGYDNKTVS